MHDGRKEIGSLRRASFEKRFRRFAALSFVAASLVWYAGIDVRAQSSNPGAPTPITDERLASRVAARDIGDPRATTHFYTFETRPGDLELQVVSENLNGDVDLFVAENLRPLTKVTLLASPTPTRIARTIFMREGATLILRVVARSPGDEAGTYEIIFGGTFQASTRPAVGDAAGDVASNATTSETPTARRVTSSGARIDEPAVTVSAPAPRVPASPESAAVDDEATNTVPAPTKTRRVPSVSRAARRRNARAPRPPRTDTRPGDAANADPNAAIPNDDPDVAVPPIAARPDPSPARARRPAARRRTLTEARLVIRTRDGERFERSMIDVERVLVEGGELIVLLKSGEERRLSFADVTRFAIEP